METLKRIFKVESTFQLAVVVVVFSITGSLSVVVSGPILSAMNIDALPSLVYWPARILATFVAYQLLLICVGTAFGQFAYFWRIEKRMLSRFGVRFD